MVTPSSKINITPYEEPSEALGPLPAALLELPSTLKAIIVSYADERERALPGFADVISEAHTNLYHQYKGSPTLLGRMLKELPGTNMAAEFVAARSAAVAMVALGAKWNPNFKGKDISELNEPELNDLGKILTDYLDSDLILFFEALADKFDNIKQFNNELNSILPPLNPQQKAERISDWLVNLPEDRGFTQLAFGVMTLVFHMFAGGMLNQNPDSNETDARPAIYLNQFFDLKGLSFLREFHHKSMVGMALQMMGSEWDMIKTVIDAIPEAFRFPENMVFDRDNPKSFLPSLRDAAANAGRMDIADALQALGVPEESDEFNIDR